MEGFTFKAVDSQGKGVQQTEEDLLKEAEEKQETQEEKTTAEVATTVDLTTSEDDATLNGVVKAEPSLDDDAVLDYLSKKLGKDITLDMIGKEPQAPEKPTLNEGVSALVEYMETTGRGIEDYVRLNRDFTAMSDGAVLREYLKATEEGLDDDDINVLMSEYNINEEQDSEADVRKKKLALKKTVNKARKFFEETKSKYKEPVVQTGGVDKETQAQLDEYRKYLEDSKTWEQEVEVKRNWFEKQTGNIFDNKFEGFKFNIDGADMMFKPSSAEELKTRQQSPQNFVSKFLDDKGMLSDAEGYHRALAIAMNPQKFAEFFYNKGKVLATEQMNRDSKNIDMGDTKNVHGSTGKSGFTARQVNASSGNGLRIKPFK